MDVKEEVKTLWETLSKIYFWGQNVNRFVCLQDSLTNLITQKKTDGNLFCELPHYKILLT